jgi:hypothetical protein
MQTPQQQATVYIYLKNLLAQDEAHPKAIPYALKHQIIEPAHGIVEIRQWLENVDTERRLRKEENLRNAAIRDAEDAKRSQAYAEQEVLTVPLEPVTDFDGWPLEAEAEVWAHCRNPRMVIVRFDDGRTASMWKGWRRNWPVGLRAKVAIADAIIGEPIYRSVEYSEAAS